MTNDPLQGIFFDKAPTVTFGAPAQHHRFMRAYSSLRATKKFVTKLRTHYQLRNATWEWDTPPTNKTLSELVDGVKFKKTKY